VSKSAPRIEAYGEIDELNAILGMVRSTTPHDAIQRVVSELQTTLFTLGAQLASPTVDPKIEVLTAAHVESLERQIDTVSENLPAMRHFILPGGSPTSALLHLARTVCRRAERRMVHLTTLPGEAVDHWVLVYVNRLSDFLFTLARLANQLERIEDIPWLPKR